MVGIKIMIDSYGVYQYNGYLPVHFRQKCGLVMEVPAFIQYAIIMSLHPTYLMQK